MICPLLTYADMQKAMAELAEVFQLQIAWLGGDAAEIRWTGGVAVAQTDQPKVWLRGRRAEAAGRRHPDARLRSRGEHADHQRAARRPCTCGFTPLRRRRRPADLLLNEGNSTRLELTSTRILKSGIVLLSYQVPATAPSA
jgi:hypothetical protein